MLTVQLSILEIVFFQLAALIIGFVAHYLWSIRNGGYEAKLLETQKKNNEEVQWRLKYYELVDKQQQDGDALQKEVQHLLEQEQELLAEMDELRALNKELMSRTAETAPVREATGREHLSTHEYAEQLRLAQEYLSGHNQSIQRLLQQVKQFEEAQAMYELVQHEKELLNLQVQRLQKQLDSKQEELDVLQHRTHLETQVKQQLQNTYTEFHLMQEKIRRLEAQLAAPVTQSFQVEELQQANELLNKEVKELRNKYRELAEQNTRLQADVTEAQSRYRDAQFHQQHLQKRNEFLEQFNQNLQTVTDQNKRLEEQMLRISQMEDELAKYSGGQQHS